VAQSSGCEQQKRFVDTFDEIRVLEADLPYAVEELVMDQHE
jgi:hypothetical protein